ncbi:hypothetical protein [Curtobacterium sp. 18060]|uniref:hypothetical protein n=1 Tax=Curtobacterium sp. 18060 TaxID=2681408 RepID=UPI00135A618A|nr:hypothetical protein [Curtobacterium sp. 18060]
MTTYEVAMKLTRELRSVNTAWDSADVFTARSVLKSSLASLLAHSVGESNVCFLHATISEVNTADALVRVIAFTDETLTIVFDDGAPSALVLPRRALRGITLHDAPNLLGNDPGSHDALRLSLDYGDASGDAIITLGHALQTPRNITELQAFMPSLQSDLLANGS